MIFIGPTSLSGIGQVTRKYALLFGADTKYCVFGEDPIPANEHLFVYALPTPSWIKGVSIMQKISKSVSVMTICETETVHEDYGKLFALCDTVYVQSEFCRDIFKRQFPGLCRFQIIHQYVPAICKEIMPEIDFGIPKNRYVFYHIGNILDPRKNINGILNAFLNCGFEPGTAHLVLKATCLREVHLNGVPDVTVINGLIEDDRVLQQLHRLCNCYVSFSFSEGIGMGAVEAALHDKPVIVTEYGGAKEYIKTPYMVKCGRKQLERDDFLFKKGMVWGDPDTESLMEYMRDAYARRLNYMDHAHTKKITGKENVLNQFRSAAGAAGGGVDVVGEQDNDADKQAAGHE